MGDSKATMEDKEIVKYFLYILPEKYVPRISSNTSYMKCWKIAGAFLTKKE